MAYFSVIIPTYNRRDYLLACLDRVAAQRHAPHEVIVVDDGSSDGTCEAVEGMEGVRLIRQENAGPGAARNRGAQAATGDYLAFLDSDDLWFPWSLKAMAELIEQHRPALLFARFENFTQAKLPEQTDQPAEGRAYPDFLAASAEGCYAGAGMMVVARDEFHAVGGFAEDRLNAEDHDLALRLGTAPGFVQVTAPLIVAHRQHSGNEMADLRKSLAGIARLVTAEREGKYGGGTARQAARREIITRHCRPAILKGLAAGERYHALSLYFQTLPWHLRLARFRFLVSVPLIAATSLLSRGTTASEKPT
jgi:GT2 family glycosyltransferase